jgi:hypothetical protein
MVMDIYSARYLVPLILMAPFSFAPLCQLAGHARLSLALTPYLVSAAVAGWLSYGSDVDGFRIQRAGGPELDEQKLAVLLREHEIEYGFADYWTAYRLTFLFRERPVFVPLHESQDRYPPYREGLSRAPVVAYVYDPSRSGEDLAWHLNRLRSGVTEYEPAFDEVHAGRYTMFVLHRKGASSPGIRGTSVESAAPRG